MRITVLIGDLVHDHGKWINKSVKTQEKDNNNNNNKVKGLDFLSTWHPSLSIVLFDLSPKKEKEKDKGNKNREEEEKVQLFKVVWDRLIDLLNIIIIVREN